MERAGLTYGTCIQILDDVNSVPMALENQEVLVIIVLTPNNWGARKLFYCTFIGH